LRSYCRREACSRRCGESALPQVCLRLPVEFERVDAWLDDERFFAPFVPHFSARMGRLSIPMETYLRLMFLKHRYRLGSESLCGDVSDSISWRRFCRIDYSRHPRSEPAYWNSSSIMSMRNPAWTASAPDGRCR
jgi:Transposase domain (DUF772)